MNIKSTNDQTMVIKQDDTSLFVKQFNGLNIKVYGTYEEPLFKAKDIGDLLEIKDIKSTIRDFDKDEVHSMHLIDSLGRSQETNMLTEQGLYKLLMISRRPEAKSFQKWVYNIIKEIRLRGKYDLEEKLKQKEIEYQRQIEAKEQELLKYKEKTYETIEKNGHVYVIKTDAQGAYKVGKTKDCVSKRIRGLQTGNVDDIEILLDFRTSNPDLLERCVHYILDRYRCNSNREFFDCDVKYIENIVKICGTVLDTLKSTYEHITQENLMNKLREQHIEMILKDEILIEDDESDFDKWLDIHLEKKHNSILHLKDVCHFYTGLDFTPPRKACTFRCQIEQHIKKKYNIIKPYRDSTFNGQKYRGWLGWNLK